MRSRFETEANGSVLRNVSEITSRIHGTKFETQRHGENRVRLDDSLSVISVPLCFKSSVAVKSGSDFGHVPKAIHSYEDDSNPLFLCFANLWVFAPETAHHFLEGVLLRGTGLRSGNGGGPVISRRVAKLKIVPPARTVFFRVALPASSRLFDS